MSLLEAKNITKTYADGTKALRGVDVEIDEGEYVAVMGPSGSGKSTLLHILGFLDRHTTGTYRFKGKQFDDHSSDEQAQVRNRDIGFVFQMFNLLPNSTIVENVQLPLMYSDIPEREWDRRAGKVLEKVGLSHRLDHTPAKLSGGERGRVAIARALITDPAVIFADEPTGNLDTASGEVIMGILEALNRDGRTIVVITHEDDIAQHMKRIIKIVDGTIESDRMMPEKERIIAGTL